MRKEGIESKKKIRVAFMELMKYEPYDEITIKQICMKANVSRQTFYNHYENKDVIFSDLYMELLEELCIAKMNSIDYFYSDEFLNILIDTFDEWSDLFVALKKWDVLHYLTKNNLDMIASLIINKTEDDYIKKYPNYFLNYIYEPLTSICLNWIYGGKKESKE